MAYRDRFDPNSFAVDFAFVIPIALFVSWLLVSRGNEVDRIRKSQWNFL